jgi:tRNA (adenine22-N1)-methyltransferase
MGGILITQLLENGREILKSIDEIILSPHTDIEAVRRYLQDHGYRISEEEMIVDEGKFYVIIKANHGEMLYNKCELCYGRCLLENKNPVLMEFLVQEENKINKIKSGLNNVNTVNASRRINELNDELCLVKEGLKYYEMQGNYRDN